MAVEVFKLFGSIFVNNDEANKSIAETEKKGKGVATTLGSGVKTAAKWGAAVLGGATAAATGLTALATKSASTADTIDKMSQKIGVSREAYQELDFICSQSGMDVNKLQSGMKSLVSAMDGAASGTASNVEQFKKLGVSVTDANGNLRNSEDVMWETMEALQNCGNETEKTRLATELFGKSGTEMMPLLNGASGSIEEMKNKAHDLGLVLGDEAIDNGVKLTDTMDQMKRSLSAVGTKLGAGLMPILQQVCQSVIDYMPQIQAFFDEFSPIVMDFFEAVMPVLMQIGSEILPILMDLLTQLMPVFSELMETLAPIIVQIVEQLFPPLLQIIQDLLPYFMQIITAIMPLFGTLVELLTPVIEMFIQLSSVLLNGLLAALTPIIEDLATFLNDLLTPLIPIISELCDTIVGTLQPVFEQLSPVISQVFDALRPILDLLGEMLETLIPALVPVIEWLAEAFSDTLGWAIEGVSEVIDDLSGVFSGLVDFIKGVFSGDWEQAWNGIVQVFKNVFNILPTIVENIINGVIGIINGLLSGIDWATSMIGWEIDPIPEVTLPRFRAGIDYVPHDKYAAYLDAGEAVLTAQEAEEYRQSKREGRGSVFENDSTNIVNNISINIPSVAINNDMDIDSFVDDISNRLADEITRRQRAYA